MATTQTGYLFDKRFLEHDTGMEAIPLPTGGDLEPVEHPSAARITRRTHALIAGSGLLDRLTCLPGRAATEDDIALYHTRPHITRIRDLCAAGGGEASTIPGESAPVVPASYDVALLAAGGGMTAVDAVMQGEVHNAYALLRPPGHHAMANESMGFCIFNNVVIATRHAQRQYGVRRIMIVDWDVHHGNGTQAAFYDDPDVLFVSLHQENWYPEGWGKVGDTGSGVAAGHTINVPLPPGTGNRGYLDVFERIIRPVARTFGPELVLVSAGQDPSMTDPLGRMMVTMDGFRTLATQMLDIAAATCDGRLIIVQEGGYSAPYAPFCTLAVVEALVGHRTTVLDPYTGYPELRQSQIEYDIRQSAAIDRVIAVQAPYWRLSLDV